MVVNDSRDAAGAAVMVAAVADVPGRRQTGGAAATELGGDRVDGETAMAVTLVRGCDVQPPQTGPEVGLGVGLVEGEVDVDERHEEADRSTVVPDQPRPGAVPECTSLGG